MAGKYCKRRGTKPVISVHRLSEMVAGVTKWPASTVREGGRTKLVISVHKLSKPWPVL